MQCGHVHKLNFFTICRWRKVWTAFLGLEKSGRPVLLSFWPEFFTSDFPCVLRKSRASAPMSQRHVNGAARQSASRNFFAEINYGNG